MKRVFVFVGAGPSMLPAPPAESAAKDKTDLPEASIAKPADA